MFKIILHCFFWLSLSTNVFADTSTLNSEQILDLFSDKTANCIKTKDDSRCLTYMSKTGDVKRLTHDDGVIRLGTWKAKDDQLCILWANKKKDLCFDVAKQKNNEYLLLRKGKTKSVITAFSDGDGIK